MDDMEELSAIEDFSKLLVLGIGTNQARKPIISDNQTWQIPQLTIEFQDTLSKDSHLLKSECCVSFCINMREYFLVV